MITKTWPKITKIPMRNKYPQFEVSDLLLDLDAEDSKLVRSFDENIDGVPEESGAKKARDQEGVKHRAATFDKEYERDENNFQNLLRNKYNPFHVSDLDIVSAAIRGPRRVPPARITMNRRRQPPEHIDD